MSYSSVNLCEWACKLATLHQTIRSHPDKKIENVDTAGPMNSWLSLMSTDLTLEDDEPREGDESTIGVTDVIFSLCCYSLCSVDIKVRRIYTEDGILDLIADVTLMACRHETIKHKKPVQSEYVKYLFDRVASFVCRYSGIPSSVLMKSIAFAYPNEEKETAYRELIELPYYGKWLKPKQARQVDTYKELEEVELIEKLKKMELDTKKEMESAFVNAQQQQNKSVYKHIFQITVEMINEEDDVDIQVDDVDKLADALGEWKQDEINDAQLIKQSLKTHVEKSGSLSSSSSFQSGEKPLGITGKITTPLSQALDRKIQKRIKKSPMADSDAVIPGQNRGDMWLIYRDVISNNYLSFFNHIFYGAFIEIKALESCTLSSHLFDTNKEPYRDALFLWLEDNCSIDSNDDFMPRFRSMTQERLLPMGIRSRRYRRESTVFNWEQGMELMQDQLGMHCSTILHDIVYAKKVDVCKDRDHPCFESLCITMFSYMVEHSSRDKSMKFSGKYYLQSTDLTDENIKWLKTSRLYGYPRPPVILEVLNRFFVNVSIVNEEDHSVQNVFFECKDMIHAILSWVYYLHKLHNSTIYLSVIVDLKMWFKEFFVPKEKPLDFMEMINTRKIN